MRKSIYCVVGKRIRHPNRILHKLSMGKLLKPVFLVCFDGDKNKPEILNSSFFYNKYINSRDYEVIAIFKGEAESLDYVRRLVNLSYRKYDDLKLKETIDSLTEKEFKYLCESGTEEKE